RISGRVPFSDPLAAQGSLHLELRNFRLVVGPRRLTIESLTMNVVMAERTVELKSLAGRLLKGEISAQARVDLGATDLPATVKWTIKDLDLAEWRPDSGDSEQSLKG